MKVFILLRLYPDYTVDGVEGVYTEKARANYQRDAVSCASDLRVYRVEEGWIDPLTLAEYMPDRPDLLEQYKNSYERP